MPFFIHIFCVIYLFGGLQLTPGKKSLQILQNKVVRISFIIVYFYKLEVMLIYLKIAQFQV